METNNNTHHKGDPRFESPHIIFQILPKTPDNYKQIIKVANDELEFQLRQILADLNEDQRYLVCHQPDRFKFDLQPYRYPTILYVMECMFYGKDDWEFVFLDAEFNKLVYNLSELRYEHKITVLEIINNSM